LNKSGRNQQKKEKKEMNRKREKRKKKDGNKIENFKCKIF
jgi:hypothetical protein